MASVGHRCYARAVPSKTGERSEIPSEGLSRALDTLYSTPLDQFVPVRRELAAALRGSGDASASQVVAAAAKPPRTVWALNQVARRDPQVLRALFAARHAAEESQNVGEARQIRDTARDYRERIADVVRAVRDILAGDGAELTAAQARRIGETLQAAAAQDSTARSELVAGRLSRDVDSTDPFAGIELSDARATRPTERRGKDHDAHEGAAAARAVRQVREARQNEATRQEREKHERARALEAMRKRISELEHGARDARAKARDAEVAARRAQELAEKARRHVDSSDEQVSRARAELRDLEKK